MSSDAIPTSDPQFPDPAASTIASPSRAAPMGLVLTLGAVAAASLIVCGMLWQRLGQMQEQLALQSAQTAAQAVEARTLAKDAQDLARDSAARVSVMEARVGELSLQRTQLEELTQSLSRTRDENLVADIESSLRLALQQAELSGSLQPLVAMLQSAQKRLVSAAQPRLAPVIRAIEQDLQKISRMSVTDTAGVLARIEELTRQVDELPLIIDVGPLRSRNTLAQTAPAQAPSADAELGPSDWPWWQARGQRLWDAVRESTSELVQVRRIDRPEAALVAPEQGYFLRENLKLKLLNARLALLSRQWDSARKDLNAASTMLNKYFDTRSRRTQTAQAQLQQIQSNLHTSDRVQIHDTLSALNTAAAGR